MRVESYAGCWSLLMFLGVVFSSSSCAYEEGEDQVPVEAAQESEVHQ
jgi:hypothetical protein